METKRAETVTTDTHPALLHGDMGYIHHTVWHREAMSKGLILFTSFSAVTVSLRGYFERMKM